MEGQAFTFRRPDSAEQDCGQVWVTWAAWGDDDAVVEIPVVRNNAEVFTPDGRSEIVPAVNGRIRIKLTGDAKMPVPALVVDRLDSSDARKD